MTNPGLNAEIGDDSEWIATKKGSEWTAIPDDAERDNLARREGRKTSELWFSVFAFCATWALLVVSVLCSCPDPTEQYDDWVFWLKDGDTIIGVGGLENPYGTSTSRLYRCDRMAEDGCEVWTVGKWESVDGSWQDRPQWRKAHGIDSELPWTEALEIAYRRPLPPDVDVVHPWPLYALVVGPFVFSRLAVKLAGMWAELRSSST